MAHSHEKPITTPTNKTVLKLISKFNVIVYRMSGGRIMGRIRGTPVCLLTATGRKSGRKITNPVMYNPHGEDVLLVASLGGGPKNPAWYHNLIADPNVVVQTGWRPRRMLARQVSPEEKAALWPDIVRNFPSYGDYQKATSREIPVILCKPA